jgi:hypothetical protein
VRVGGAAPADPLNAAVRDALARTGLDLSQLLAGGADALVVRPPVNTTALTEVLEQARGALVRNAPQELLDVLDREWPGAARSPAGWYYRAAALALLGLPGEAERVLADGLALHEHPALHFARSVTRVARGDLAGGRADLTAAWRTLDAPSSSAVTERGAAEQLLRAWETLLLARRGDFGAAEAQWRTLSTTDDPTVGVLAWLQRALARVRADVARTDAMPGEVPIGDAPIGDAPADVIDEAPSADAAASPRVRPGSLDAVDGALHRLGARWRDVTSTNEQRAAVAEVFATLQALSTGGTLWDAAQPARVHAARGVLTGALQVLMARDDQRPSDPALDVRGEPIGTRLVELASRHALAQLAAGAVVDARRALPRVAATEGPLVAQLLAALIDGAEGTTEAHATDREAPRSNADAAGRIDDLSAAVRDLGRARADELLASPLRLGLLLVPVEVPTPRRTRVDGPPAGVLLSGQIATAASRRGDDPDRRPAAPQPRSAFTRRALALGVLLLAAWWWLSR